MFAGSSRGMAKKNGDGSYNIFCYQCQRYITRSFVAFNRALCYICQCAEEGRPVSPELLAQYEASKMERADVSYLNLPEPEAPHELKKKRGFSFAAVGGQLIRALGRFGLSEQTDLEKKVEQPSAQIARAKRRPRLFSKGELTEPDTK